MTSPPKELTDLPEIGDQEVRNLKFAGLPTVEHVAAAEKEQLVNVEGISPSLADRLVESTEDVLPPSEVEYAVDPEYDFETESGGYRRFFCVDSAPYEKELMLDYQMILEPMPDAWKLVYSKESIEMLNDVYIWVLEEGDIIYLSDKGYQVILCALVKAEDVDPEDDPVFPFPNELTETPIPAGSSFPEDDLKNLALSLNSSRAREKDSSSSNQGGFLSRLRDLFGI